MATLGATSSTAEFPAGGGSITVEEQDGTPSVASVTTLKVPNGSLTDDGGGVVSFAPAGSGDVVGPAASVDAEIALFDSTTGKLLKRATGTGVVKATSGVYSTGTVALGSEVSGDLPYASLVQASAANKLIGRGSAGGAGDFEEITLGSNLTMTGTTLSATGGGSGNVTDTGADSSGRPGTPAEGDLYFPNNGIHLERYSGSVWVPWGPLFPMTRPVDGDFAWINQGGASVNQTHGGIYLEGPAGAGVNWRIRKKAAPSTPYTITTAILLDGISVNFHQIGILFRQSSNGRLQLMSLQTNGATTLPFLYSVKYTNPTTFSATYTSVNYHAARLVFLRIADNGTNRICSYSPDGHNFQTLHSVGRTDFLTADEVGFAVNAENATFGLGISLVSWTEA